jgi:type VII secretion protein EccB
VATKKDLVEAYSFSRRRLVTAFVSGAPGGREVEPARPARSIVGGLAFAVLLVAGAAIAGVFSSSVDPGWADSQSLVISKEEGTAYVIVDDSSHPELHPILNITSAKLILGPDPHLQVIPDEYINTVHRGTDLGILGAPADVPAPSTLVPSGWTACTDARHGIRLDVSRAHTVSATGRGGLLVQVGGERYVVAESRPDDQGRTQAYRYHLVDSPARDNLLRGLQLPPWRSATPVTASWLNLFPPGGDLSLDSFHLTGLGQRFTQGDFSARVGDVVNTTSGYELVTQQGLADLDPFAFAVYTNLAIPVRVDPQAVAPPNVSATRPPFLDAGWPATTLTQVFGEQCGQLEARAGQPPVVHLARDPQGNASAAGVDAGDNSPVVDDGAGAYVLSGSFGDSSGGHPFLVDSKGQAYPLVGGDAPSQLGYGGYRPPVVPDSWIALFDKGVELSKNLALCSPRLDRTSSCG